MHLRTALRRTSMGLLAALRVGTIFGCSTAQGIILRPVLGVGGVLVWRIGLTRWPLPWLWGMWRAQGRSGRRLGYPENGFGGGCLRGLPTPGAG